MTTTVSRMSRKMKTKLLALTIAMAVGAAPSAFAQIGVPVMDPATWAALAQQLLQAQEQFKVSKQQFDAITGSYGRGQMGLSASIQSSSVVPGSWQEVVAKQNSGAFGASQNNYEKLIQTMPQELFQNPKGQEAVTYKLSTDAVRAAMTGGDALYGQVQTHLNNLSTLASQVDRTENAKDAADLQNRIAVENGMLNTAMAKISVMNMNLQTNMLNERNQEKSENAQRYKRTGQ